MKRIPLIANHPLFISRCIHFTYWIMHPLIRFEEKIMGSSFFDPVKGKVLRSQTNRRSFDDGLVSFWRSQKEGILCSLKGAGARLFPFREEESSLSNRLCRNRRWKVGERGLAKRDESSILRRWARLSLTKSKGGDSLLPQGSRGSSLLSRLLTFGEEAFGYHQRWKGRSLASG